MSRANPRFRRNNLPLPIPAGNLYRIFFYGQIENQMTISVFHYQDTQAPGIGVSTGMNNLMTNIRTAGNLRDKYAGCISADWTMTSIKIDSPNNPSVAPIVQLDTTGGGMVAVHEPTQIGVLLVRYTAFRGQCGRGRITLPAPPTASITASKRNVGSALDTAVNTLIPNMQLNLTQGGITYGPGLISRGTRVQKQLGFGALTNVISPVLLATVRRRKIGKGK